MSDKTVLVGFKIDGDASGAKAAISTTEKDLQGLSSGTQKTKESSDALNASFSKLGIRSAIQIEADILAVNQELLKLASNASLSGSEFDRAYSAGQAEIKRLRTELKGASGDVEGVTQRTNGMISAMGKLGLAFSGAELARQFVKVNIELENIERTFTAITGSSALAAKELEFVREVADRLGIDGISAAKAFAQLSASTKGTGAEGKVTRDIFESVARAMSVAGKSSDDTEGALQALAQMASKGVISMEEMRQQLGERLPGAMAAAAKGFGITTAELNELIESGKLTAEELFPALKKGLDDLYGATGPAGAATETLAQEIAHAKNTVDQMYKSIGDSGVIKGMVGALEGLSTAAVVVSNVLVTTGKTIGTFFAAIASGDIGLRGFNENAKKAFAEIAAEAQDKLVKAAMHNKVLEASLDESGKKALAAARAQQTNAAAAEGAGQAALALSADWTTLNVAYGKLEKTTEAAVKQSVAVAEAKKAETSASVALANAFGTEAEKLAAQSDAGKVNAEATAAVAERKKELYAVTKANIEALQNEIDLQVTKATPAQEKVIADLQKIAESRKIDAEKAIAQADATRLAAAEASAASEAYADNSARLGELKIAYDQAREAVAALRKEKATGADVTAQLTAAELAAARAAALYRDAQKDLEEKIKAVAAAKTASNSVEQAGIRLAIEQQRTIYEVAKAKGDEQGATKALLEIKRLEIELARLTAEAKKAEAEAGRLLALAKIEEIRTNGQMTEAKRAEIAALEASIKVKEIEAQIAGVMAERLKEVAQATRDGGNVASDAAGGHDRLAGSLEKVASSAGVATKALKDLNYQEMVAKGMSQSEISNQLSDRQTSDAEKAAGIVKRTVTTDNIDWRTEAIKRGLSSEQADRVAEVIGDEITHEMETLRQKSAALPGYATDPIAYRTEFDGAMERALGKAMETAKNPSTAALEKQTSTTTGQVAPTLNGGYAVKAKTVSPVSNSTTVNIVINGKKDVINVTSADDAMTLTSILKQLESAAARAF